MTAARISLTLCLTAVFCAPTLRAGDWPVWRGPNGNGIAEDGQDLPTNWSETENVVWKSPVPGRGHSSPIVVGGRVILTTADEAAHTQSAVCFHRETGEQLWMTEVHRVPDLPRIHRKNTHASPTAAWDGERLFALFFNTGMIHLTSLSIDGQKLWQKQAGSFRPRYKFGYAASPLIHGQHVIVASEFADAGFLAAFERDSGLGIWRAPRNQTTSYSSPIVGNVAGREQLLMSGAEKISSYDPLTGKLLWETKGGTSATSGTMVWTATQVYASGGYPDKVTIAVMADGSGKIAWKNQEMCYEQSLLAHNGYVYALNDGGIALCWRAKDGREMWKERLGGPVSASPILAGEHIFASNEQGQTFVFRASPSDFTLVATNQLGDEAFATPAICGDRIFLRVATYKGESRQEWLYCVGTE